MVNSPQNQFPELRKALNLRGDEIVVLTKACCGLIDAPRRWWKSLVPGHATVGVGTFVDMNHASMTWHVRGKLKDSCVFR